MAEDKDRMTIHVSIAEEATQEEAEKLFDDMAQWLGKWMEEHHDRGPWDPFMYSHTQACEDSDHCYGPGSNVLKEHEKTVEMLRTATADIEKISSRMWAAEAEVERLHEAERISRDREAYLVVIDTMHALKARADVAEAEVERLRSAQPEAFTGDNLEEIAWALKPAADTGDDCVVNARAVYDAIRAHEAKIKALTEQVARSDEWLAKANEVIRERAVEEIAQVLVTEGGMSPEDARKVAPSLARAGIKPKTDKERA